MLTSVRGGAWLGSRKQAGLSLVELMVGVAIGLFVVAGATVAVSNQLGDNRRLMLETQVQQDLRAAADLIARDLRRAGYWGAAETGVWNASSVSVASNPYAPMSAATSGTAASAVTFAYSRSSAENNSIDATDESGFRLSNAGVIEMRTGGGWQALTDSNTMRVTNFQVKLEKTDVALACFNTCPVGAVNCPPTQSVRDFEIVIDATAVHDPNVKRSVRSMARLRNDVVVGACPA
jgi:prepilin peptidase dependent protein B